MSEGGGARLPEKGKPNFIEKGEDPLEQAGLVEEVVIEGERKELSPQAKGERVV